MVQMQHRRSPNDPAAALLQPTWSKCSTATAYMVQMQHCYSLHGPGAGRAATPPGYSAVNMGKTEAKTTWSFDEQCNSRTDGQGLRLLPQHYGVAC
jgi:hypothetical protein